MTSESILQIRHVLSRNEVKWEYHRKSSKMSLW